MENSPNTMVELTKRPPGTIYKEQLAHFNLESLRVAEVQPFDAGAAVERLCDQNGKKFLGVDIGGDKLGAFLYEAREGRLLPPTGGGFQLQKKSDDGVGYLSAAERAAEFAITNDIGVGISYAGTIEETWPVAGLNVKQFLEELGSGYGGDFKQLFPTLKQLHNDATAGLIESAVHLARENQERSQPLFENIIYLINGSGLGGAVLTGSEIHAAEPGHVEAIPQLIPPGYQPACGMDGAVFTCLERVAASKAGIEAIWKVQTGSDLSGPEIEERYMAGDERAAWLYENSTQAAAHAVMGIARVMGIDLHPSKTAIVGHGGGFKFLDYSKRMGQHLRPTLDYEPHITTTYRFSDNACLDGAATAAALVA